jgi:hypothetical protein
VRPVPIGAEDILPGGAYAHVLGSERRQSVASVGRGGRGVVEARGEDGVGAQGGLEELPGEGDEEVRRDRTTAGDLLRDAVDGRCRLVVDCGEQERAVPAGEAAVEAVDERHGVAANQDAVDEGTDGRRGRDAGNRGRRREEDVVLSGEDVFDRLASQARRIAAANAREEGGAD